MKVGDLVKIIQGGKLVPPEKWLGKPGLVVDRYHHPTVCGWWWLVAVAGQIRPFHEDYLELVNEAR